MRKYFLLIFLFAFVYTVYPQQSPSKLLYGVAYYDEYMPYERLDKDVQMMKEAGINVVRIAESTWSTEEPQDGVFDFSHIDRVLNAMQKAGIHVIIGTPTYAVPTWLVRKYPDVLAITPQGPNRYGSRQNMDITNKHFLFHAERIIRKMLEHVKDHPAIIGYQIDNETKAYNTAGPEVQKQFVAYMKEKFISLDSVNRAFGLDYWSNRINAWDDFPSMTGSINASQRAEFEKFQRKIVTDYLAWQAKNCKSVQKAGPVYYPQLRFWLERLYLWNSAGSRSFCSSESAGYCRVRYLPPFAGCTDRYRNFLWWRHDPLHERG